jgi:hypothetical protein
MTLALAGGSLAAQAPPDFGHQPGPAGREQPGRDHAGPERMLKALGLSKEQDQAVRAVLEGHRTRGSALRRAAMDHGEALRAAAEDPAVTDDQLRTLNAAAGEAHFKALLDHRAMLKEIEALLTPAQRTKAARLRANLKREREAQRAVAEDLDEPDDRPSHGPVRGSGGEGGPPPLPRP